MTYSRLICHANRKEWGEFEVLANDKNKKDILIPYEEIAEILIDYGEINRAEYYTLKIPALDRKITYLKCIQKWKKIVEICIAAKKYDILETLFHET